MDARLAELYMQRGRLRERISVQRGELARDWAPLKRALGVAERAGALLRQAQQWLAAHPAATTALVVALAVWRPRAVWRSLRWGYSTWRSWLGLRAWLHSRFGPP